MTKQKNKRPPRESGQAKAAIAFLASIRSQANGHEDGVPWFHGWAILEAYAAGFQAATKHAEAKATQKP